jgi:predicted MFS family arabinose efflux permease
VSAAVVLGFVPAAARAAPSTARRSGLLVGVRALFADRLLRAILMTTLVAHVALAALFASLPAFAFQHFHDPKLGGILFAADATGSVLGGLLTMRLARRTQPMALGIVGFALMAAPLLLAFGAARPLAVATLFVFGIGGPLGIAPVSAVLTSRCTPALRPQTVSAFLALSNAGTPLGSGGAGWVITRTGLGPVFAGVGGAMATAALLLARAARQDVPTQQAQPPTGHTQAAPTG